MRKQLLILILALLNAGISKARTVDPSTAKIVAQNFTISNLSPQAASSILLKYTEKSERNEALYYVFSVANDKGYVIVSSDDAAYPILAHSFSGAYKVGNLPPGFMYWMNNLKKQLLFIKDHNLEVSIKNKSAWERYINNINIESISTTVVEPLIKTSWGQIYENNCGLIPFNQYSPPTNISNKRCPTGCVATAMAQIMKYWNYPTNGVKPHCYTDREDLPNSNPSYGQQCAPIGSEIYDWYAMKDICSSTAIATLIRHCAVSVDMDYAPSSSGAYTAYGPLFQTTAFDAYQEYFNYNTSTIKKYKRDDLDVNVWITKLKDELDAYRPLHYAGHGTNSIGKEEGHSWVCDGYKTDNSFHMNWGWGDGTSTWVYMDDLILHEDVVTHYFNSDQQIIVGITPPQRPDLVSQSAQIFTNNIIAGAQATASTYIMNQGTGTSNYTYTALWLSKDQTFNLTPNGTPADINLNADIYTPSLLAGSTSNLLSSTITIPAATETGIWYILVGVDAVNCNNESNENNNQVFIPITVINSSCVAPANDVCSASIPQLPVGSTCNFTAGDISCATQSLPASSCASGLIQDVWYKFTATSNGLYTIRLDPSSGMDGVLEVRQNSCSGPVLNCVDAGGGNGAVETIELNVTNGTVYYIRVYEYNAPGNTTPPLTTAFNICIIGGTCSVPTTQASNISFSNVGTNAMTINWTNGNGSKRIVKMNKVNSFTNPVNGTNPAANNVYSGTGEQIIYDGGGNSVSVSGLNTNTTGYCFRVYEANCTGASTVYNTNAATNNFNCFTASQTYSINTTSNPLSGGTILGSGNYSSGQQITLQATPNPSYTFVNWTENGNHVTSTSAYTFNVTGNRNLVANFTNCSYALDHYSTSSIATATSGAFWVNTSSNCSWEAITSGCSGMITLTNSSGIGNGLVTFNVSANPGSSPRTCTITVNGLIYTITQVGLVEPCLTAPSPPNSLSTGYTASNTIGLSWGGSSVNVSHFEIERSTSSNGPFVFIGSSFGGSNTNYFDNTGVPGTTYYYRVRACCNTNCSSYSNTSSATSCVWHTSAAGITASNDGICSGDNVTLSVQGGILGTGDNWVWRTGTTIVGTGLSVTVSPTSTAVYYVKPEGSTCPQPNVNGTLKTITVNSVPTPSVIVANGSIAFCNGGLVGLSGNNGGIWNTGDANSSIVVNTSGDYFVTNTNNCGSVNSNHIQVIAFQPSYTFIGSGNWDNPSNWSNRLIPPSVLSSCSEIIIDPVSDGECILNVPLTISAGAKFTVKGLKKFRVLNNLLIQNNFGEFVDSRDGQTYKYTQIGTQTWMTQNLNYNAAGSWCYNNSSNSCSIYGRLYDWVTALSVAPEGWHLASDAEWKKLINFLGGESVAGGKLKDTGIVYWSEPNTDANNSSGFWGLPGGYKINELFTNLGYNGMYWSSDERIASNSWAYFLGYDYGAAYGVDIDKTAGMSVRCVKDLEDGNFTDPRDGQVYPYKQIGSQVWMTKNMNFNAPGSWCYEDNSGNCDVYGRLYDWNTSLTIAPPGWHIPSLTEWNSLISYLGGDTLAGGKMKEAGATHWLDPNVGATNSSGFSGLPGGLRTYYDGSFNVMGVYGIWRSSTVVDATNTWGIYLYYNNGILERIEQNKNSGYSIRCIKD